jgi:hypothetical protein
MGKRCGTSELASAERPQGGPEGVSEANNLQTKAATLRDCHASLAMTVSIYSVEIGEAQRHLS